MLGDAIRNLKLDRRLVQRRGWIDPGELDRELEGLPDAAEKIAPPEEREPESTAPAEPS